MKRVIITGPTGAIGIALINKLIEEGVHVTAVCHRGSKRVSRIPQGNLVNIIECDLDELEQLPTRLSTVYDVFYHFAWACTVGDSRNNINAQMRNIQYTIAAVETAKQLGCKKFIGAGSQAEYGRYEGALNAEVPVFPENGYGIAKLCAGQLSRIRCHQLGMEHIWTRILSVYGPCDGENTLIMSLIRSLSEGNKPKCTKGEQIWDYIYSGDAANAFYLLGKCGIDGKVYCIGNGQGYPLSEYITALRDMLAPDQEIGFGDVPYNDKQVMYLCADISELQDDTGFIPEVKFAEGIANTIKWYRDTSKTR